MNIDTRTLLPSPVAGSRSHGHAELKLQARTWNEMDDGKPCAASRRDKTCSLADSACAVSVCAVLAPMCVLLLFCQGGNDAHGPDHWLMKNITRD